MVWADIRLAAEMERAIYEAVATERQRCAEKCQRIMNRHIDEVDRKRHVEDRSVEAAMALGAAESSNAAKPTSASAGSTMVTGTPTRPALDASDCATGCARMGGCTDA